MANKLATLIGVATCLAAFAWAFDAGAESAAAKSATAIKDVSEIDKLMQLSNLLDDMDRQEEFDAAMAQANGCIKSWSFDCAEAQLARAAKSAKGAGDANAMASSRQSLANERPRAAIEARRRAEVAEREDREDRARRREAREEREAREARDERAEQRQAQAEREGREARNQEIADRKERERQAKADHDKDFQDTLNMIRDAGNSARASIEQVDAQNRNIYAITQAAKRREEEEERERQRERRHEHQEESSAAMAGSGRAVNGNSTGNASNYSSDSPSASQLDKICKSVCSQYVADCDKPGAQSACHSASACTFRCFANNAPNHPDRSEWLRQATKEDEIVRSYRYDGPTFSSEPSRQTYQPPPQPTYIPAQPKRGAGIAH